LRYAKWKEEKKAQDGDPQKEKTLAQESAQEEVIVCETAHCKN